MQRTPVRSRNGRNTFADGLDQRLQVLERTARQHPVAEIEDVARATRRPPEHLARPLDHELERAEQHSRVKVALYPHAWPTRRQPASRSTRQSSEMTSAPELAISSSSPAVEVPKWILGTPSARVASKIRRVEGNTRAS